MDKETVISIVERHVELCEKEGEKVTTFTLDICKDILRYLKGEVETEEGSEAFDNPRKEYAETLKAIAKLETRIRFGGAATPENEKQLIDLRKKACRLEIAMMEEEVKN